MSALLAGWRTIYDRIKEIELTIMLNNVTDGAVTLRVKEAVKLANLVQIAFDDQYQRLKSDKIKITTTINTRIRQIAAVLADLVTFIPGTAQKFLRLIQQSRRDIDILLTQFQFKLPVDGYASTVSKKQKARPLFNNYSVRNEYSAYDRSSSAGCFNPQRSMSRSKSTIRYDPLSDKQLIQLQNTLYEIEAEQRRQDDAAAQVKCAELGQKIKDIQEHYKQQNFLLQNQINEKDGEIAYVKGQLEQLQQVDDSRKRYIDQITAENTALKDKITVLQNQCILAETQQNNERLGQLEEARNTVLIIEKQRNRIHALEQQLSGVSTYVARDQYKVALDAIPEVATLKAEFVEQIRLMQGSDHYENLGLVVDIFVNGLERAISGEINQAQRAKNNRERLSTVLRERFDALEPPP